MKHKIIHTTIYRYQDNAESCHNLVHLQPRNLPTQSASCTQFKIDPVPEQIYEYVDYFGNHVHSFAIYRPHATLTITAETHVTLSLSESAPASATPPWDMVRDSLRDNRAPEYVGALEHRFDSVYVRSSQPLYELAASHFPTQRPLGEAVLSLTRAIYEDFRYDPEATAIDTSLADVLEKRRGVCQDFAHVLIGCLRSLGLAARYVSGYLRTDPQPGKPRLQGVDASHAWASVFCPGTGWIDFDPTNGCQTSDRHITVGWGRDFHDVSPVKGIVLGGGQSSLQVAVDVLAEEPGPARSENISGTLQRE